MSVLTEEKESELAEGLKLRFRETPEPPSTAASRKRIRTSDIVLEEQRTPSALRIVPTFIRPQKRLRRDATYPSAYEYLLQTGISGGPAATGDVKDESFETSYVGVSQWTSEEKQRFFNALDVRGQDNVRAIATLLRSKTQPEVAAYVSLLQKAASETRYTARAEYLHGINDSPAAYEVAPYCEDLLEGAADALATRQLRQEEQQEKLKYRDAWLLNHNVAQKILDKSFSVRRHLQSQGIDATEEDHALRLIRINVLLHLSADFFMNSEHDDWNYASYAEPGERPSMHLSALVEIYRLTRTLIERLLLVSQHCARSRIRALEKRAAIKQHAAPKREVKDEDVDAAVKIFQLDNPGLQANSHSFWDRICDNLSPEDKAELARLDTVLEAKAQQGRKKLRPNEWRAILNGQGAPLNQVSVEEDESETSLSSTENSATEESSADEQEVAEETIEKYLETLDAEAAKQEEAQLLHICGTSATQEDDASSSEVMLPQQKRIVMADPEGWRASLDYQSEWERFSEPIDEKAFERLKEDTDEGMDDLPEPADTSQLGVASEAERRQDYDDLYDASVCDEGGLIRDDGSRASSSEWSDHDPDSPSHQAMLDGTEDMEEY